MSAPAQETRKLPGLLPEWLSGPWFGGMLAVMYVAGATWFAWTMLGRPAVGMDDANIFFVYARNVIHGHGLVYSVGGEHVEGFSSPLYLLVCVLAFALSRTPEMLLLVLNCVFAVCASLCVLQVLRDVCDRLQFSTDLRFLVMAVYFVWLLLNPCYFAWSTVSLMDTALYSLLLAAGYALLSSMVLRGARANRSNEREWLEQPYLRCCGLIVFLVLARPEGLLWATLLCAGFAGASWQPGLAWSLRMRRMALPQGTLVLSVLGTTIFRLAYFGYPLPNTYYAKVSSSLTTTLRDGASYFAGFIGFYGLALLLPLALVMAWLVYWVATEKPTTPVFSFAILTVAAVCAGLAIPVLEGGDHFYGYRMFQPVMPLLFVSFVLPMLVFPWRKLLTLRYAYVVALGLTTALASIGAWSAFEASNRSLGAVQDMRERVVMEFSIASMERDNGERLHALLQQDLPRIAYGSAGGIAYGYNGTVYDMMGLNDIQMAHADKVKSGPKGHQSFNKDVFYRLAPDVLMPRAVSAGTLVSLADVDRYYSDPGGWDNAIFKGLFEDARFRGEYTLALISDTERPQSVCYGYFRNEYLARLGAHPGAHPGLRIVKFS